MKTVNRFLQIVVLLVLFAGCSSPRENVVRVNLEQNLRRWIQEKHGFSGDDTGSNVF